MMVCCQPTNRPNQTQPNRPVRSVSQSINQSELINFAHRTQPVLSNGDGFLFKETPGDCAVWSETVLFPWIQVVLSSTLVFAVGRLSVWKQQTRNKMKSCSNERSKNRSITGNSMQLFIRYDGRLYRLYRECLNLMCGFVTKHCTYCSQGSYTLQNDLTTEVLCTDKTPVTF